VLDGVRIGLSREGLIAVTLLQSVSGESFLYTAALKLVQLCKLYDFECKLSTWSLVCVKWSPYSRPSLHPVQLCRTLFASAHLNFLRCAIQNSRVNGVCNSPRKVCKYSRRRYSCALAFISVLRQVLSESSNVSTSCRCAERPRDGCRSVLD